MSRPSLLPGVLGELARKMGCPKIYARVGVNHTRYRAWAMNRTGIVGYRIDLLNELLNEHNIKPILYTIPCDPSWYVASTVFGWITWRWNLPVSEGGGYQHRVRFTGSIDDLAPVDDSRLGLAKESGWPY